MATSASVHTNTYGGRTITLLVEEISTSIDNNTSTVRWTLTSGTSSTYHSVYDITAWVGGTASSNKVYGSKTADWSTRAFPCKDGSTSGTLIIPHNADGTASPVPFRLRGSVFNNNPQNYDGSIDLTTIPRASTISSVTGGTIGQTLTIGISRASSSFTHEATVYYGNDSQTMTVASNQESASVTLKMEFCNQIPNATTAQGIIALNTKNGNDYIGDTQYQLFTMSVPSSVVPSVTSVTKSDTSNLLSSYGAYVQGKSSLRVQTSASGSYSSSISNVVVNTKDGNGNIIRTLTGSNVTFANVNYVGTATVEVIVTDSRGRQASNSSTISVAGYSNPNISYFTAERLNNDSTVTLTWDASITNINNANVNSKSFNVYKRQKGTSSWGSAIATYSSGYTYTNNNFTTTCDENYGWEFKFVATDSFTTSTNESVSIGTAFELMNWKADGTAVAIGKVSEESNTFEVALNTKFINGLSSYNGLELLHQTPYIDFHFNNSSSDYTSRIIEDGSGHLDIVAGVNVEGTFTTTTSGTENTTDSWVPVWSNGYLYHRVIDPKINQAMDRSVHFKGGTGSGTTDWHCIGGIDYDYHVQGSFCYVKIILGQGNNGTGNQNAWIDLYMQLGWTGSVDGRFGCYAYYHPGQTNMEPFNTGNTQIKVMANSRTSYAIFLYSAWGYSCPNVIAYVPDYAHFIQHDFWTSNPNGTQCDLIYDSDVGMVLYENATGQNTGTIYLNDYVYNYHYVEVFYKPNADVVYTNKGGDGSIKIPTPDNKSFQMQMDYDNGTYWYHCFAKWTFSGSTIVKQNETRWRVAQGNAGQTRTDTTSSDSNITIYRVIGYR